VRGARMHEETGALPQHCFTDWASASAAQSVGHQCASHAGMWQLGAPHFSPTQSIAGALHFGEATKMKQCLTFIKTHSMGIVLEKEAYPTHEENKDTQPTTPAPAPAVLIQRVVRLEAHVQQLVKEQAYAMGEMKQKIEKLLAVYEEFAHMLNGIKANQDELNRQLQVHARESSELSARFDGQRQAVATLAQDVGNAVQQFQLNFVA
jgi:hypothetical protein